MGLRRVEDRIAIHYSQASIRAHWMFDSREDGDTWPRRFSSYEATHSRFARVRGSFARLIADLGYQPHFVSYEQIERGNLLRRGNSEERAPGVLLLPQSVAMSRRECEQVAAFVRAGGTVIADNMTATMDEHCKRLSTGQLGELFGIRRRGVGWRPKGEAGVLTPLAAGATPLQVFEPDVALTTGKALLTGGRAPAVVVNRPGKGSAIYLNLDLHDYSRDRLRPAAATDLRNLFRRLLAKAGMEMPVTVVSAADGRPAACVEVWRYCGSGVETIAVMRNPDLQADSEGQVRNSGSEALEKPEEINVRWSKPARVKDLRSGRVFALTDHVTAVLDPWSPLIMELRRGVGQ
jgi:glycosyl hydrolase family 42 (putative beta-galactosidase)